MKNRSFVKTLALSTLLLCGAAMAQNTLRIGFFPDPYADQFKPGVLPALERAGTKVNATEFSNIIQRKDSAQVSHTTAPGVHAAVAGSSVDSACAAIREAIRSGRFAGGDRIREVEVCALARVSRTSVRQALTLLAAEGFVELRPNRGAVVIDWTDANLLEIFDLRALLEGYGAALAAGRATRDEVEQMRRAALNFQALTRKPQALDMRLIAESNNRLHRMILDAGKNQRVASMLTAVVHIPLVKQTFAKYSLESLERSAMQHLDLVSAIESGDAVWAEAAMRSHIHAAKRVIFGAAEAAQAAPNRAKGG